MDQFPKRVNAGVLSAAERRLLDVLVRTIPSGVSPHHLTAFGFLGGLVAGAGYLLSSISAAFLWLAILGIAMNWFGDSLDGSLARHRRTPSRAGAFADHTVDALAELAIMLGLGLSVYVRLDAALAALVGYYLLTIGTMARALAEGIFSITYAGLGPTEVRLALVCLTLGMIATAPEPIFLFRMPLTIFDGLLICFAVGTVSLFTVSVLATVKNLSR